ncbi:MAG: hypothetical protein HPY69_03970 [Armatimonadetes bacterium]|nr:hypothetical protein [Armatimonadota bacterium]
MRHPLLLLMMVHALACGIAGAQYDFAAETEELSVDGETVQQAAAYTAQALRGSQMRLTISTVGFDIEPGSEAERGLRETAQIGGGGYFTARDSGELISALGAAASGQTVQGPPGGVTLVQPRDGDVVGPSIEVKGQAAPGEVIVIFTVVYNAATGEKLRTVPGIRHRNEEDGSFSFRVATPRLSFGNAENPPPLSYEMHVHTVRAGGSKGPETVLKLRDK